MGTVKELMGDIHNIIDESRRHHAVLSAFIVPEPMFMELQMAMDCGYGTRRGFGTTREIMQAPRNLSAVRRYDDVSFIGAPNLKELHCIINGDMRSVRYVLDAMKQQKEGIQYGEENTGRLGKRTDKGYSRTALPEILDEEHERFR